MAVAIQLLSILGPTIVGAVIGYIISTLAEKRALKRTLEAEARAQQRAIEAEVLSQKRAADAIRRQLLLVLESVRGRFETARLQPDFPVADDDPATSVLFTRAFAHETALALSADEARHVQQAALRAYRVANGISRNRSAPAVAAMVPDEQRRIISSGAQSVVQLVDKAISALGGPLQPTRTQPSATGSPE